MPLLILAGARDRLVEHRCSLTLARAWQADMAVHPKGGHDLPLDQGQWVVRQVGEWVREKKTDGRDCFLPVNQDDGILHASVWCSPKAGLHLIGRFANAHLGENL